MKNALKFQLKIYDVSASQNSEIILFFKKLDATPHVA